MNTDYLKEFEEMNVTFDSVFDLGKSGLLVILEDGTNLTSWDDVDDYSEVIYISEDLSCNNWISSYFHCKNSRVIVLKNYTTPSQFLGFGLEISFFKMQHLRALYAIDWDISKDKSMKDMFAQCHSLEYVYGIESWDTSNVKNFWGAFGDCYSLKTLDGLENWDMSSAVNMESMFDRCKGLEDISAIADWDMSNVENIFEMFRDCYSLRDASCLNWKFENLKNGGDLFINCDTLKKLPPWYDDEFTARYTIRGELEKMDDKAIYDKIKRGEYNKQDIFVAISYIEDEGMLRNLFDDSSLHEFAKRAVLLNPNFTDTEILEDNALNNDEPIHRVYAFQNPNFKNVKILNRISKEDESYQVRYTAKRKLKEMLYNKFDEMNEK